MRNAICELLDLCPPSMKALRANVVLLYGNVEDEFSPGLAAQRCALRDVLVSHYEKAASNIIVYSLQRGLHRVKSSDADVHCEPERSQSSIHPTAAINRAMSMARRPKRSHPSDAVGPFTSSPAEALREISRQLAQSRSSFVFFAYSPLISLIADTAADVAPLLESLPDVCRRNEHLVVFAGSETHPDLERALPNSKQKTLRLRVGGPSRRELEATIVAEEVMQRRSLVDCLELPQVMSSLEYVASQPSSGLKTVVDNYLRAPDCWLNGAWAKENGAVRFDPDQIDIAAIKEALQSALVGQDAAKRTVLDQLLRFREFGRSSRGPFLRLLFVGPSGVGKTEMARIVCKHVFDSDQPMLLVACTEYSQPHEVAKLLGAPPGYMGHDQPALLESHRKRFPAGLILLDEFEKAHADIHRFFMNLLEEGTVTSPRTEGGQPIRLDFTNYIVIATSNAGSREIDLARSGSKAEERHRLYDAALKSAFPVELLGRFQERVVFDYLSPDQLEVIARRHGERQLEQFAKLCDQRKVPVPTFDIEEGLYRQLVQLSDPTLGARDLRGKVERHFQQAWLREYGQADPKPDRVRISVSVGGPTHA